MGLYSSIGGAISNISPYNGLGSIITTFNGTTTFVPWIYNGSPSGGGNGSILGGLPGGIQIPPANLPSPQYPVPANVFISSTISGNILTNGTITQQAVNGDEATEFNMSELPAIFVPRMTQEVYMAGGDDIVRGNSATQKLYGGDGNDFLDGKAGNDRVVGNAGADHLYGGAGADVFGYMDADDSTSAVRDVIWDFSRTEGDKIDLSDIDANSLADSNQAFTFIGTNGFSGSAGELRYEIDAAGTHIYSDINGNGVIDSNDLVIDLKTAITLTSADFVL